MLMANLALNMEILDLLNKESVSGASSLVELVYKFDGPTANGESIAKVRFKYFWGYTNIYIYIYIWTPTPIIISLALRVG